MRPPVHMPEPAMMIAPLLTAFMAMDSAVSRVKCSAGRLRGSCPYALTFQYRWLIVALSRRLAQVAGETGGSGFELGEGGRRQDGVEQRGNERAQQSPDAVFYAASRRGESPRWSAISGSVNKISSRCERT